MNQKEFPEIETQTAFTRRYHRRSRKQWRLTASAIAIEATILVAYAFFVACWTLFSFAFQNALEIFFLINEPLLTAASTYQVLSNPAHQHRLPFFTAVLLLLSQFVTVVAFTLALVTSFEGFLSQALGVAIGSIALRILVLGPLLLISSPLVRLFANSSKNRAN